MKKAITFAVSTFAVAAAVFAADPTPQEIQRLVQQNNAKAGVFKRTLEQIPNWHNDKTKRNPEFINSNLTELVKLIKLPVGAANITTEAGAQAIAARAYAQPLNLRLFDLAKKHYTEALRLAATPVDKANIGFDYADYMLRAAMEGDAAQWTKAKKDAYATAGLEPADKLNILARGVPGLSYEKDGWEIVKDKPALQAKYYTTLIQQIRSAEGWQNHGGNPLDYFQSNEHKLEIADKALACQALPPRDKAFIVDVKAEALVALERFADAENLLISMAASTNAWNRSEYSAKLGDFYVERAKRYYSDPDTTLLEKAYAAYAVAIAHSPNNGGFVAKQITALMQMKKYDDAIARTDDLVSLSRDKVADKTANRFYADCYYYKGDYEKACEYYGKFDDGDKQLQRRYAEALYVTGRYDDAIAHIKRSYNDWSFKEANKYFIRKIEEKKAATKTED